MYIYYNGVWEKAPRSWRVLEDICVKSNLILMKLLLSVGPSYRKKLGEQDVLVIVGLLLAPPIILLGEQLLSLLLRFRLLWLLVPNGPFTL